MATGNILDERPLTDAERVAIADEPRPGVWIEEHETFAKVSVSPLSLRTNLPIEVKSRIDVRGDGRALTQHVTDVLIATELQAAPHDQECAAVLAPFAGRRMRWQDYDPLHSAIEHGTCTAQRGGIHSDPLVRLLAFRAWGDRDRAWRKRDTARAIRGQQLDDHDAIDRARRIYGFDGLIEYSLGEFTANRNGRQATASIDAEAVNEDRREWLDALLDCLDELDAKLSAGGEPVSSGPLTFELRG